MFYIANQQIMDMENLGEGLHNQEIFGWYSLSDLKNIIFETLKGQ